MLFAIKKMQNNLAIKKMRSIFAINLLQDRHENQLQKLKTHESSIRTPGKKKTIL